jgi:hypothetical protein
LAIPSVILSQHAFRAKIATYCKDNCVLSGLDIYCAAKKFEIGVLCDFADVEGFQQLSFVGQDLNFVTRAAGSCGHRCVWFLWKFSNIKSTASR